MQRNITSLHYEQLFIKRSILGLKIKYNQKNIYTLKTRFIFTNPFNFNSLSILKCNVYTIILNLINPGRFIKFKSRFNIKQQCFNRLYRFYE